MICTEEEDPGLAEPDALNHYFLAFMGANDLRGILHGIIVTCE